ncbi:MAG: hypothetical protein IJV24_05255 [Prevotella sp.]|nr:hypothetical protein [Prevotella sp.]
MAGIDAILAKIRLILAGIQVDDGVLMALLAPVETTNGAMHCGMTPFIRRLPTSAGYYFP